MQRVIVKIDNDSDETMSRSHGDNDYEYDVANRKPPHRLGRGLTQNIQYINSVNIQNAIKTLGERMRNKASRYGGDVNLVCNTRFNVYCTKTRRVLDENPHAALTRGS